MAKAHAAVADGREAHAAGPLGRERAGNPLLVLLLAVVLGCLFAGGLLLPIRWVFLGSELLIAILYASSLNLLMGYGGMLSFGHSAYYAVAAYASGLLFA